MLDADTAATDAGKLARFAERVRDAARPPAGPPADRVRRLFARADLVRQWPALRGLLTDPRPPADAALAERGRQLAERCRSGRRGWIGGWPKEALELLADAGDRLAQLADRLDAAHTPTGLVARLSSAVAQLSFDQPTAQLVNLGVTLAGLSDACRTFTHDLAEQPLGHVFGQFAPKLRPADGWTPDARAAAGVVCVVLDRLTERTSDPKVWAAVRKWAEGWFAGHGVSGAVLLDEPPPDGVIAESFPLKADGHRAVLAVASPDGPALPDDETVGPVNTWADLPPVPEFDGVRCAALESVRAGADESEAKGEFGRWLESPAGADWFHYWLSAVREGRDEAAAWWRAVKGRGWCEAFPDPDAMTGEFDWPAARSRAADVPFDRIAQVRRFAPNPADSRVTLSDGPGSAATEAFAELFRLTAADPRWWGEGRWHEARRLTHAPQLVEVAALAGYWLDECRPGPGVVDAVCRWVESCGMAVVRADAPDTPGVQVRPVFDEAEPGTVIGSNGGGFGTGGEVFRPAVVEVSLGPSPAGFAELMRAGEALPRGGELRAMVAGLRAAAEGNYLREAVLQLYSDFWGEAGAAARAADPRATAAVGERLSAVLTDAYGLRPFVPVNVHDLPNGWISVAPGSRVMTGVVTRVLRPGLLDDHGHLRIPAVAEVD